MTGVYDEAAQDSTPPGKAKKLFWGVVCFSLCLLLSAPLAFAEDSPSNEDSPSFESLFNDGMMNMQSRDFDKAVKKLEEARKIKPDEIRAIYQLGLAYYNLGLKEDDIEFVEKAQEMWRETERRLPKDNFMANTMRDIISRAEERKKEISENARLEEAYASKKDNLEEGLQLATLFKKRSMTEKATMLYNVLMQRFPYDPRPIMGRANIAYSLGRILWAEKFVKWALKIDPANQDALKLNTTITDQLEALRYEGFDSLVAQSH